MRLSTWTLCMGLILLPCQHGFAQARDIKASQFFARLDQLADTRKYVYIQIPAGDTLVFRDSDNELYILHGRALSIRADNVRVDGKVVIRSFSPMVAADHGEDRTVQRAYPADGPTAQNGLNYQKDGHGTKPPQAPSGVTGNPGGPGPSAHPVRLDIKKLEGTGDWSLLVANDGGKGGLGQQGSDGLKGGRGGDGRNREACGDSPGNAGEGGDGGFGGQGGPGGKGGDSAVIQYTRVLIPFVQSGRVTFSNVGGDPGEPGSGGNGADGGPSGTAGAGKTCNPLSPDGGGVGANPGASHRAEKGPKGGSEGPGKAGEAVCINCSSAKSNPKKPTVAKPPIHKQS